MYAREYLRKGFKKAENKDKDRGKEELYESIDCNSGSQIKLNSDQKKRKNSEGCIMLTVHEWEKMVLCSMSSSLHRLRSQGRNWNPHFPTYAMVMITLSHRYYCLSEINTIYLRIMGKQFLVPTKCLH